jgi:hypothetical protein
MIQAKIITPDSIMLVVDGDSFTITSESHRNYDEIRSALAEGDNDYVESLIDIAEQLKIGFKNDRVSIVDGKVYIDDVRLSLVLEDRIISMVDEGFDAAPMCKFVENLYQNPSAQSVDQLYAFLEKCNLPITEDGCFIAYKRVRDNYTDVHSGKFDNSIGQVVEMIRNQVNDNRNQTCSSGLHFCSQSYLAHFGGSRIMIVKINPRDVVSIPNDYGDAKGRCCKYEVIGELVGDEVKDPASVVESSTVYNPYATDNDDDWDDWEEDWGDGDDALPE